MIHKVWLFKVTIVATGQNDVLLKSLHTQFIVTVKMGLCVRTDGLNIYGIMSEKSVDEKQIYFYLLLCETVGFIAECHKYSIQEIEFLIPDWKL